MFLLWFFFATYATSRNCSFINTWQWYIWEQFLFPNQRQQSAYPRSTAVCSQSALLVNQLSVELGRTCACERFCRFALHERGSLAVCCVSSLRRRKVHVFHWSLRGVVYITHTRFYGAGVQLVRSPYASLAAGWLAKFDPHSFLRSADLSNATTHAFSVGRWKFVCACIGNSCRRRGAFCGSGFVPVVFHPICMLTVRKFVKVICYEYVITLRENGKRFDDYVC